jgi:hypothetical protein
MSASISTALDRAFAIAHAHSFFVQFLQLLVAVVSSFLKCISTFTESLANVFAHVPMASANCISLISSVVHVPHVGESITFGNALMYG